MEATSMDTAPAHAAITDQDDDDRRLFLATAPARPREWRLGISAVILSAIAFAITVPFAHVQLPQIGAFLPSYASALAINDLITAILLFSQFSTLRTASLLVLASGYLLSAMFTVLHALSFPGLFSTCGLLSCGHQVTPWIFTIWHSSFPLCIMAYTGLSAGAKSNRRIPGSISMTIGSATFAVGAVAGGVAALEIAFQASLPVLVVGIHFTRTLFEIDSSVCCLILMSLAGLYLRRPHTVLDIWLMAALAAGVFEVALVTVFSPVRFDLGWYCGRFYGFLASSFVLAAMLSDSVRLDSRLAVLTRRLQGHAAMLERRVLERTGALTSANEALAREISEHRRTGAQLVQSQKMEAIGQFTGGIAHDFNNMLGIIIGNLDLVRERVTDGDALGLLDAALDAALRGAELNKRMLAFARHQSLKPKIIDVNATVTSVVDLLRRSLGEKVEIRLALDGVLWPVMADPAQLEAALVNLGVNARDAMPTGGILTIETHNSTLGGDYAERHQELSAGDYVMLAISDTGTGMLPEVLEKVFEPFFTTKPLGEGTGLGLSMVYGFMKQSGGHINIYSEPGRGTTLRLYLPRLLGFEKTASPVRGVAALAKACGESVLVVEDNAGMRLVTVRQLRELGYRVSEAENAEHALALIDAGSGPDLVVTDVIMPGSIDGMALAQCLREKFPDLCILLISGFTEHAVVNGAHGNGKAANGANWGGREYGFPLLAKPFRKDDLAIAVRQALSGTRETESLEVLL